MIVVFMMPKVVSFVMQVEMAPKLGATTATMSLVMAFVVTALVGGDGAKGGGGWWLPN